MRDWADPICYRSRRLFILVFERLCLCKEGIIESPDALVTLANTECVDEYRERLEALSPNERLIDDDYQILVDAANAVTMLRALELVNRDW